MRFLRQSLSEEGEPLKEQAPTPGWLRRWLSRIVGIALFTGVIIAATHYSENRAFLRLAIQAKPEWLLTAILLQAATYFAQGEIWRSVGRAAKKHLPLSYAYKLALAKLFVDQALPSAGISGTLVVAQVLEKGPLPRGAILAGVVINTTSFFTAYALALAGAGTILLLNHESPLVIASCVLFIAFSAAVTFGLTKISGKHPPDHPHWLVQNHIVQNAMKIMKEADPRFVRSYPLQIVASCYQLVTFLLDAVTLWVLIRSLGANASVIDVYASYMVANLVRTVSFVPGGLGTFEGALLLLLRGKIPLHIRLAAALLFRGLTFFIPMIPGFWFSHRLSKKQKSVAVDAD